MCFLILKSVLGVEGLLGPMARCWLHQFWRWFLLVIFLGWFLLPVANTSSNSKVEAEILVFLREICNQDFNTSIVQNLLDSYSSNNTIAMISKSREYTIIIKYI